MIFFALGAILLFQSFTLTSNLILYIYSIMEHLTFPSVDFADFLQNCRLEISTCLITLFMGIACIVAGILDFKKCPECGKKIPKKDNFCPNCGNKQR